MRLPGLTAPEIEARRFSLGGSDAGAVLGLDPYMSRLKLYQIKVGDLPADPPNAQMKRGIVLEPIARRLYRELTKRRVSTMGKRRHPKASWLTCHVDGAILGLEGLGVLEIKCPSLWAFQKVKREGMPDNYIAQMMHNMMVTGYRWGSYAVFNADLWEMITFDLPFDEAFAEKLFELERAFWFDHVQAKVPPAELPISGEIAAELQKLGTPGEVVMRNDPEWADAARRWSEADELYRTSERLRDQAKADLKALMGGPSVVQGAGLRVHWSQQDGRRTLDQGALAHSHPEIDLTQFEKQGKPFDVFHPYRVIAGVGD